MNDKTYADCQRRMDKYKRLGNELVDLDIAIEYAEDTKDDDNEVVIRIASPVELDEHIDVFIDKDNLVALLKKQVRLTKKTRREL